MRDEFFDETSSFDLEQARGNVANRPDDDS